MDMPVILVKGLTKEEVDVLKVRKSLSRSRTWREFLLKSSSEMINKDILAKALEVEKEV